MNKLFMQISFALFFCLFLFSCAPSIKYHQLKPARFSLGKEPSFKIGKVAVHPKLHLLKKQGKGFWGAVGAVAGNALETWSGSEELKKSLEQIMRSEIAQNQFATYKHNAKYKIDLSGEIEVQDSKERKTEDVYKDGRVIGKKKYWEVRREYDLNLRYEVVFVGKGKLAGANVHRKYKSDYATGKNEYEVAKTFDNWEYVTEDMIQDLMPKIMSDILPYFVKVKRKFRNGEDSRIKEAGEIAENGDLKGAKILWEEILKGEGLLPEDEAAIHHNIGVLYEKEDKIESAIEEFSECRNDSWCNKAIARLRQRKIELERIKESI
ncbi:MAG: hypothetical protein ABIA04_13220 [Pseudomonadota bacterium]